MKRLLMAGALFASGAACAEQGCPNGMYPGGAQPNGPICVPIPGAGGGGVTPGPRWRDRWGAIATDYKHGYVGVADRMVSRQRAEATAIERCRQREDSDCLLDITYVNRCAAYVNGADSHWVSGGVTVVEAVNKAMRDCSAAGETCSIFYQACSLPE